MTEHISSYRLEEEIAHGGMGIVYRGVHTVFDEVVAIKAIFPELTLNPELRERFLNEAKIQRRLQHPNIVQLREFLIDQGKFYIVIEFIEGETLTHHLRQLQGPTQASEAVPIFHQALEGLGFAHAQGVIHRDIKPSNIMLTRDGVAKLTDFGIARALGSAKLTRTGTALGTPAYMSPEQIQGTRVDHRTDIYSMGITLYEMLTGRVPFERPKDSDSDFPVLAAHINQAPTQPSQFVPEIPLYLEAAILKALAKKPEERFQTCQEFQRAIVPTALPVTVKAVVPLTEPQKPIELPPEPSRHEISPEPTRREAEEKASVSQSSPLKREPRREPKAVFPPPPGPQFKTAQDERRSRVVLVGLIIFVGVILAASFWVYWPSSVNPPSRTQTTPPEEKVPPTQSGMQATASIVNNPHGPGNPPAAQARTEHSRSVTPATTKRGGGVVGSVPPAVPGSPMPGVTGSALSSVTPQPPPRPKPQAPKRIRVGGQVEGARLIFGPKPEYPPVARMARVQGMVRLDAVIGKDGTVQELKVISGHPFLAKAAMNAVKDWRYQPTLVNGESVEVATEIDVNFTLSE